MYSFSEMVDDLSYELLRPDLKPRMAIYLNQTITECHSDGQLGTPVFYGENRLEDEYEITSIPALWVIPNTARFQAMEVVYNDTRGKIHNPTQPMKIHSRPGDRITAHVQPYWYRTGPNVAIAPTDVGETFLLSWFERCANLYYWPTIADRPARWNRDTQTWTYHADYNVSDLTRTAARALVTNWMLERYPDCLMTGVRNKVHMRLGEKDRANMYYSTFDILRNAMKAAEEWKMTVRN